MTKYIGSVGRMWNPHPPDYFVNCWDKLLQFSRKYLCKPGEDIHTDSATVSWHSAGRNELVERSKGDWLLMLDTDHQFAPDLLDRLLFVKKQVGAKVINGIYQYKFPPHAPVMNLWGPNSECLPITSFPRDVNAFEIGSAGGGCLLVDRQVYSDMIKKYKCNPFDIIQGLSEDYSFFWRCKEMDIPVFMAPKIQCHHVINTVLSLDDYIGGGLTVQAEGGKLISC